MSSPNTNKISEKAIKPTFPCKNRLSMQKKFEFWDEIYKTYNNGGNPELWDTLLKVRDNLANLDHLSPGSEKNKLMEKAAIAEAAEADKHEMALSKEVEALEKTLAGLKAGKKDGQDGDIARAEVALENKRTALENYLLIDVIQCMKKENQMVEAQNKEMDREITALEENLKNIERVCELGAQRRRRKR